jgi:hypothetical protein
MADDIDLNDDGNAAFDVTDRATGAAAGDDVLIDILLGDRDGGAGVVAGRFHLRCRKCGSSTVVVNDTFGVGSSRTGPYGLIELACADCGATRAIYDPT